MTAPINKRLDDILPLVDEGFGADGGMNREEAKAAILSLFREVVEEAKPEFTYKKLAPCEYCRHVQYGHDPDGHFKYAVDQYHANLLQQLGEKR